MPADLPLSAQDLRNGLAALAEMPIKGKDARALVALMDRYTMAIGVLEAPPKPAPAAEPVAPAKPTNGEGHSTPDA